MRVRYKTFRRVEFGDTDMAGIAHFSNFFRYMEEAEHEFLRHVGQNVVLHDDRGTFGFPKLEAHCEYKLPAVYDAKIVIELVIHCDDGKTIQYDCSILQEIGDKDFSSERRVLAEGYLRVACCRFPKDGLPYPIPIPESVLKSIRSVASKNEADQKLKSTS